MERLRELGEAQDVITEKKLDSIIEKFKSKGYQIYCNRLLAEVNPGHIPNNPCVELAFIKI